MNLSLFFDSIAENDLANWASSNSLFEQIEYHHANFPDWKHADLAFFTLESEQFPQSEELKTQLRGELAKLKPFSKDCKLVDLGDLRVGETLEDTQMRLAEVCEILIAENTLPIIIGSSHIWGIGQFLGYQNMEKLISIVNIDAQVDLSDETETLDKQFLHQIFSQHPNYLFDYNHLGYQRYLNVPKVLQTLETLNFHASSIGEIRNNLQNTEPVVRLADMLMFDISALKKQEVPAFTQNAPFGLTGEEACQLGWYAGLNEKLTSFGLFGSPSGTDSSGQTASVLAIMLWYFIEGFCHRKTEYSFKSNFHTKYIVPLEKGNHTLVFYKSKVTDKWWMEVGNLDKGTTDYDRHLIIPCSYTDYETANKGELPERWLRAQDKLGE